MADIQQRRCFGDGDPLLEPYHDREWGFPVLDERGLFERMSLEAFQSGLSWRTILAKRDEAAPASWAEVRSSRPETVALARALKRRGFRFVGPTTLYALMQACGLVDDHLAGCPARPAVERARRAARLI